MTITLDLFCKSDNPSDARGLDKEALDLSFPGNGFSSLDQQQSIVLDTMSEVLNPLFPRTSKRSAQLIEEAMQSLSLEERERVHQEILGIKYTGSNVPSPGTTPTHEIKKVELESDSLEFRRERLERMERELQRLRAGSSWSLQMVAVELAERQNLAFVENPKFRLRFLLAEDWDATKAAGRFIRYFDWKLELFGEAKLTKTITLNDLQPEDIKMLKKGHTQILPSRDWAGRAVFWSLCHGQVFDSPESMARQYFYLASTRDKECDEVGAVLLSFKISGFKFANVTGPMAHVVVQRMIADMPIRWCAMHKFMEPRYSAVERFVDASMNLFRSHVLARIRIHQGSFTEWSYKIMSLGIPSHLIPLTADYKIKTKNHTEWLCMRKTIEELAMFPGSASIITTDLPSNRDVLLGKGKPIQGSCGNQRLSAMVDDYVEQYHKSSKTEKTALAAELVSKVHAYDGQFLSKDSGVWIAVSDSMARVKVSQMFRHQRHKGNTTAQELTGNCSTVRDHGDLINENPQDAETPVIMKRIKT